MTTTTYSEFNEKTEGPEVTKAFSESVSGKTILVTGVNRKGIGFTTAEALASQSPAHLIIASRSLPRIQESIKALKPEFPNVDYRALTVDLSSQQSVRAAAAEVNSWADIPTIDVVINSAAVMNLPERVINEDGIEMQFATNHIGHFLLTCLIMPKLIKAAEGRPKGSVRVVNVTSLSPQFASMRWSDINQMKRNGDLPQQEQPPYEIHKRWGATDIENKSYLPLEGYNQGKVANLLFSIGLTSRTYEKYGILSLAVHPGIIMTELGRNAPPEVRESVKEMLESGMFTLKTMSGGASTSLVAALDPKLGPGEKKNGKENWGSYLIDCQITDTANPLAESNNEAEKLWKLSEDLVKEKFAW